MCKIDTNQFLHFIICFIMILPGPFFLTWFLLQKDYFGLTQIIFYLWCIVDLVMIGCIITSFIRYNKTKQKTNITITSVTYPYTKEVQEV